MTTDLHHLAAAYALDALDDDERDAFEAHLADCESCRADVADFRATAEHLAAGAAAPPPDGLRADVLSTIGATRQLPPEVGPRPARAELSGSDKSRARWWFTSLSAAAAVLLVVVGVVALVSHDGGSEFADVIEADDAVVVPLDAQVADEQGSIRIVWSPGLERVAVYGNTLAAPGVDRIYELWAIEPDGTPVPAGVFGDAGGQVRDVLALADVNATAWGVTIEPAGGSPQPTSDIVFLGEA